MHHTTLWLPGIGNACRTCFEQFDYHANQIVRRTLTFGDDDGDDLQREQFRVAVQLYRLRGCRCAALSTIHTQESEDQHG